MARTDSKQRVLEAAVRTLASKGYAGTTARAIATTGGFAPGVIYYHFADLDDLFVATARFTSDARLARYRAELDGVTGAGETLRRLRLLYAEDNAEGHVTAVQELVAAATADTRLAGQVRSLTVEWQDCAADIITALISGTPFAALVPVREVAAAAVALYLGMEMLSHLHAVETGSGALFDAAEGFADLLDAVRPPGSWPVPPT